MKINKKMISILAGTFASISMFALSPQVGAEVIRVEAENHIQTSSTTARAQATSDSDGGNNLGYIRNEDSFVYEVYAPVGGTYDVSFRVATIYSGGNSIAYNNSYIATIPSTGNWQQYVTLDGNSSIELDAGRNEIEFEFLSRNNPYVANVNWFELTLDEASVPDVIFVEAEDYVLTSSNTARHEVAGDVGGGFNVGYIKDQDAFTYEINVPRSGMYTAAFRLASAVNQYTYLTMYLNDNYKGDVEMPYTGNWQVYNTVEDRSDIYLEAGQHRFKFVAFTRGNTPYLGNVNWFTLTESGN